MKRNVGVHSYETWLPGAQMVYHYANGGDYVTFVGIVIANSRDEIIVLWCGAISKPIKAYPLTTINDYTVYTMEQYKVGCWCCKHKRTSMNY